MLEEYYEYYCFSYSKPQPQSCYMYFQISIEAFSLLNYWLIP